MPRNIPLSQAVERLGCHRDTVMRIIRQGRLDAYKYLPGEQGQGNVWVSEESLERFLLESRIQPERASSTHELLDAGLHAATSIDLSRPWARTTSEP